MTAATALNALYIAASHDAASTWTLDLVWYILGLGLLAYVLTGGADFGAGLWHLLARGERAALQRKAIEKTIAPIWEANHVWLIFIVVVVFTVFPDAFAAISVALHVPILLALLGIVLRGSAFVFRAYGLAPDARRRRWGKVFSWSSLATPLFLGMTLAGMSSGQIQVEHHVVTSGFWAGWTTPFAFALGLFTVALCSLLAAVYLCVDGPEALQLDFRVRAFAAELAGGICALSALWRANSDAPALWARLIASPWFWPAQASTLLCAIWVLLALYRRNFKVARAAVALQVVLVIGLWGGAMNGDLLLGAIHIRSAGARAETVDNVLPALGVGFGLCVPALFYLFRVFRSNASDGS